jgi:hypothetical protein
MFTAVKSWLFASRKSAKAARPTARPRLEAEVLETRDCPAALTLQQFATNLINVSHTDAIRSVTDAAVIEAVRPTLLAKSIVQDLVKIKADVQNGSLIQMFADYKPLLQHMGQEVILTAAFHLPASSALATYTAVQKDIVSVATDYSATVILLRDIVAHVQTTTVPTTAPVSGLTQVYSDLNALGQWGGMTPQQNPALQNLIQSIPSSAWSTNPQVMAINQMVDHMLGA